MTRNYRNEFRSPADGPSDVQAITQQQTQHTPTPWHVNEYEFICGGIEYMNAAFIVKAVNTHERLVGAIRDELEAIRVWQSARNVPAELRDGFEISISKLRAALAEVQGE